jgi:dolichol-phosphate mannosyltransferase
MRISIILPTFNESENISSIIRSLAATDLGRDKEIIVIDDDSPDGTGEIVKQLTYEFSNVHLISRCGRSGLASAIKEGVLSSTGSIAVVMDSDGQHELASIERMVSLLCQDDTLDVVIGSRFANHAELKGLGQGRTFGSRIANAAARASLNRRYRHLSDYMSGFFAFKTKTTTPYCKLVDIDGFKFLYELLSISKGKLKAAELGIRFNARVEGESKLDLAVVWDFLISLLHSATLRLLPRRMIAFGLVGATGVIIQLLASHLIGVLTFSSFTHVTTIAVIIAASWNYTLNNQLTFRSRKLEGLRFLSGLSKFLVVSSLPIIANVGVASYVYESIIGNTVLAQFAGIVVAYVWNYIASSKVVWNSN